MFKIRTILHPTDFSDGAEYARRVACSLSRDHGARLVVVHVAPEEIVHAGLIGGPSKTKPYLEELEGKLSDIFEEDLGTHADVHVREGEPAPTILDLADEFHADLVVMGTTGRSGLGRILLGSVAEEVMRKARCPVLTVRCPTENTGPQVPSLAGSGAGADRPPGDRHPEQPMSEGEAADPIEPDGRTSRSLSRVH